MEYFRSRAERFGAEEAKGDVAAQLLNDAKQLYRKTRANNKHQTALNTEQDIAPELAYSTLEDADMVGILFKMFIDPRLISVPFTFIKEISYFKEENEILFNACCLPSECNSTNRQ
ncbi:unnamed protein product [Adineta steineri]|uniref:Uncharacterized protein n=1 Tax=Adineta steineri TaxID=433720 RepID=A0A819QFI8_9BILA|nr:unnamed protein product [Adineta steineri]CAF4030506.1 unnamed protein product [Adineta steineri]